jgi:peptide/nickel transport system substrate-binding protein
MLRRSLTGVAIVSVLALGAVACSSSSKTPKASTSGTASTAATSAAPAPATAASSAPAASSPAASSGSAAATGTAHGGLTLAQSAPLGTTQGTKAITVENNPIPTLEDDFNAFDGNQFGYKLNIEGLFYEPLLMFNNLKANTAYPWLATDFAWNADGTQITFTIRDGVKFSDGTPLTPADVAYTFQVMKDVPTTNRNGLPIASAAVQGSNQVVVNFTEPQFQNLYNVAGQTFIVKKAAYSAAPDPFKFTDPKPIGTGPYTLANFTAQGLQFKANPNYWGGTPTVPEVDVPAYTSNDVALQQLSAGKIDYAGNFVSQIATSFVAKDPTHNKYWFPAINVVSLEFNVSTGPAALKDPAVRKAISAGFSRATVAGQAEQGYEAPATSSSGLLLPNFASVLPAAQANDIKPDADAATVNTLMTGAGYAKDSKGIWAKGGTEVSFGIEDPTAYTDYYQASQIMSSELKAVGFNATPDGVDANKWYADLAAGTFDTAIHWSTTGPSPYATYDSWLDPALAKGPSRNGNYGDFENADATAALAAYAKAGTAQEAQDAINKLSQVMADQVPDAPIMYAAGWYEYNTTNYSGWVDKDNQYVDPSPNPSNVEYVILHLTPNS